MAINHFAAGIFALIGIVAAIWSDETANYCFDSSVTLLRTSRLQPLLLA